MSNLISRQSAIDAVMKLMPSLTTPDGSGQFDAEIFRMQEMFVDIGQVLNDLPSAQPKPTLHGYPIEHLEMIARVMAKENCTPEDVARLLQNTGEIARMVRDEMMEMLKESIGRSCKGVENEVN